MIDRMVEEIPAHYREGIATVDVSPRTVSHPERAGIYTMGECISLEVNAADDQPSSRVVLYHGSFAALAGERDDFDWQTEAWETLTHELRHHLEWRARQGDLEKFDHAAEQNFARLDGEPFDPLFFLDGEQEAPGWYHIDDDRFHDRVVKEVPAEASFFWHGREYLVTVPVEATLPLFLTVDGVEDPPPGELVLVFRRRPAVLDIFRRTPSPSQWEVTARPRGNPGSPEFVQ